MYIKQIYNKDNTSTVPGETLYLSRHWLWLEDDTTPEIEWFSNRRKPTPKLLLWAITTGANSEIKQSEFLTITCNLLKAREKLGVQGAIGFGVVSHWLENWQEIFKPINKRAINFDSQLKTPLRPQTIPVIITTKGAKKRS